MNYSVLVLDLDGTLTDSRKEITPHTLDVLLEAQRRGLRIVLASGRPVAGIAPLADRLQLADFGGYVLAYNGGQIIRWADRRPVSQRLLPPEVYPYVYAQAKSYGFEVISYATDDAGSDVLVSEAPDNQYVAYESRLNRMACRQVPHLLDAIGQPVPKLLVVGDAEPLHALELRLAAVLADGGASGSAGDGGAEPTEVDVLAHVRGKANVFRSEAFFLEVVPRGVDKAECLAVLLAQLGLDPAQMMACGDGYNDLTMLRYAGLGVAMANAKPEVRAVADFVTRSNDEDGVAYAVERFILQ